MAMPRQCLIVLCGLIIVGTEASKKMYVLYFMFEDLRPDLPAYGSDWVIAPNIERLARTGLVFDMAIPQVSVCAPSRTSMLTGLRPDKLGIYDFQHFGGTRFFRSIPSHFHRSGYQTAMAGKFHHWGGARFFSASYYGSPDWEITSHCACLSVECLSFSRRWRPSVRRPTTIMAAKTK